MIRRAIVLLGLLAAGCQEATVESPVRLYCAPDGTVFLWDVSQPHPHFDTCTGCHTVHPMQSPQPCPGAL